MSKSKNNRTVILEADRPRVLRASHKALKMITKMLGKDFSEVNLGDGDLDVVDRICYCLMLRDAQEHGEELTMEMVEDILDQVETEQAIIDAISDAFNAAFPGQTIPGGDAKNMEAANQ